MHADVNNDMTKERTRNKEESSKGGGGWAKDAFLITNTYEQFTVIPEAHSTEVLMLINRN